MAFLRWLKGVAIMILSAIFLIGAIPLSFFVLAEQSAFFAIFFDMMGFGVFVSGVIAMLYGWYIVKEETPKGRYRIE